MALEFIRHERIWLRDSSDFRESWLEQQIIEDPGILGLGALEVLDRQRAHERAGRLDLLLTDPGGNTRYEVELMLGATDPDHIIRCIEYWDIERRRYPAYDHVAVLVAEDITSRFLNIMWLFAGNIPLIALQLNALQIEEQLVLDFVKVLDQTSLRRDDETTSVRGRTTTRDEWLEYAGEKIMSIPDRVLGFVNEKADPKRQLNYKENYIGLTDGIRAKNFVLFKPKKRFVHLGFWIADAQRWQQRVEEAGLPASADAGTLQLTVKPDEFSEHEQLIREIALKAVEEIES